MPVPTSPTLPVDAPLPFPSGLFDHDTVHDYIINDGTLPPFSMAHFDCDNSPVPPPTGVPNVCFSEPQFPLRIYDHYVMPQHDRSFLRDTETGIVFLVDGLNQCLLTEPISQHNGDRNPGFRSTREEEFECLLQQGVFSLAHIDEAKCHKIVGSRFVDEIRHVGTSQAKYKSRLVAQAYDDNDKGILTYAPTVLKNSQRLILHVAAQDQEELPIFLRYITQTYPQAEEQLARVIYLRPPPQFGFPPHIVFRVERGLYGLPESGFLWFRTYHSHHIAKLGMKAAIHDACFLFTPGLLSNKPPERRGATCLQTDDTFNVGTVQFKKEEHAAVQAFRHKEAEDLNQGTFQAFNGSRVNNLDGTLHLNHPLHATGLK